MILKFTSPDMLNTTLTDMAGNCVYDITTQVQPSFDLNEKASAERPVLRQTCMCDAEGDVVAEIDWSGRQPLNIVLGDEKVGGLVDLFGSSTVRFLRVLFSLPFSNTSHLPLTIVQKFYLSPLASTLNTFGRPPPIH